MKWLTDHFVDESPLVLRERLIQHPNAAGMRPRTG